MVTDVADLDMPAVEREITTLAGHLAAGTCRFLLLLAAFDAGGGWHGVGLRTCAQWLSWRCGLSTSAAREQLRVAHALGDLPVVTEAFAGGRISFSKARALTRVATPVTEAGLVETATACTASQLDRLCSGLARARTPAEVHAQSAQASLTTRWEADGSLRLTGRLSAEDGATLLAALAAIRPDPVSDPASTAEPADSPSGPAGEPANPGGPAGVPVGAAVDHLDVAARAARSDAAALVLLAEHALAVPPPEVGANPVRLVIHTSAEALTAESPDPTTASGTGGDAPASAPQQAEPPSAEVPTVAVLDAGPGIPLIPLGPDTLRRLACQALVEAATHPDDGSVTPAAHRFATDRQRRALLDRDGGCAWPGCARRRGLHAHHRLPWHEGGPTSMQNLVLTCPQHHLLAHEGGWQLRPGLDHRWEAVHPGGRTITAAPDTRGTVRQLQAGHDADIGPSTVTGHWHGDPLRLDYAVSVFAARTA